VTDFIVVIPARYGSSRLPGKALADIAGRPMVAWVHERARRSRAREVIVATDDDRIAAACREHGAKVEMTAAAHVSGTDRIAELAARCGWDDEQIVVNVQGDEPLLPPTLASQVADLLASTPAAAIATLTTPVRTEAEFLDPNMVKVVTDREGFALYFSRAPIPHRAAGPPAALTRRHVGIYAYRAGSLKALSAAPTSPLEREERLEQLRALHLGLRMVVADAVDAPPRGVDTQEDLEAIRAIVALRSD